MNDTGRNTTSRRAEDGSIPERVKEESFKDDNLNILTYREAYDLYVRTTERKPMFGIPNGFDAEGSHWYLHNINGEYMKRSDINLIGQEALYEQDEWSPPPPLPEVPDTDVGKIQDMAKEVIARYPKQWDDRIVIRWGKKSLEVNYRRFLDNVIYHFSSDPKVYPMAKDVVEKILNKINDLTL